MTTSGEVFGVVSKWEKDDMPSFGPKMVTVAYSDDRIGKTLSFGSEEDGFMISVPYEAIEKIIKKGKEAET